MNKEELINEIHNNSCYTKSDVRDFLNITIECIMNSVKNDNPVKISDFGIFTKQNRAEKITTNPRTHQRMVIPACKTIKFKPGKKFKEMVNS